MTTLLRRLGRLLLAAFQRRKARPQSSAEPIPQLRAEADEKSTTVLEQPENAHTTTRDVVVASPAAQQVESPTPLASPEGTGPISEPPDNTPPVANESPIPEQDVQSGHVQNPLDLGDSPLSPGIPVGPEIIASDTETPVAPSETSNISSHSEAFTPDEPTAATPVDSVPQPVAVLEIDPNSTLPPIFAPEAPSSVEVEPPSVQLEDQRPPICEPSLDTASPQVVAVEESKTTDATLESVTALTQVDADRTKTEVLDLPPQELLPRPMEPEPLPTPEEATLEAPAATPATSTPPPITEQQVVSPLNWEGFSERPISTLGTDKSTTKESEPDEDDDWESVAAPDSQRSETRKARTPRPAIEFSEYVSSPYEQISIPAEYLYWNRILAAHFMNSPLGATIHLATSPRVLASILSNDKGERIQPQEAEAQFVKAVGELYSTTIKDSGIGLRTLRTRDSTNGLPLCIGFLALSVLAAHKMHSDNANSSSAYYVRLMELLAAPAGLHNRPKGFAPLEYEALWNFLASWMTTNTSLTLALPPAGTGMRYIGYPLAHVPLRQLDLEKLPAFFSWADYSPGLPLSPEHIQDDFRRWTDSYPTLSHPGRAALADNRASAVLAQVQSELRSWDGTVIDSQGIQSVQVDVLLETVRRQSRISILAPRRQGFPDIFTSGDVELAGTQGWYDPLELSPTDGHLLEHGFSWPADGNPSMVLRRPAAEVIVLAPHPDYSELVSRTQIPKDVVCAILCHERMATHVAAYLPTICDSPTKPIVEGNCPTDWRLFLRVRAVRLPDIVPANLRMLGVVSESDIIPSGGLRVGKWSWLQGAPPKILIEGRAGQPLTVNDVAVETDDDGFLRLGTLLNEPGTYSVKIGYLERTLRIIPASLRQLGGAESSATAGSSRPVIVAPGNWTIIGRRPGEVERVSNTSGGPSLFHCDFQAAWALSIHSGRGTKIVQLSPASPDRSLHVARDSRSQAWVSAIYDTAIRHAKPEANNPADQELLSRAWREYAILAMTIKRAWKRGK